MIERNLKRAIGQMTYGVNVVAATDGATVRAFTATWVQQVSFDDAVLAVSISPKHDTYPLAIESGEVTVSLLAGDQIEQGQYFSYPGRRFKRYADYIEVIEGRPIVAGCVAWLHMPIEQRIEVRDHELLIGEVVEFGEGRLDQPALTYSSRKGWRIAATPAREPGASVRDKLLEGLARHEQAGDTDG